MKTLKLSILVCLAAISLAACTKEQPVGTRPGAPTTLAVRFANVKSSARMRAIDEPASQADGTITLEGPGHIFVLNDAGNVIYNEALDLTEVASPAGQVLAGKVPNNSKVYIVANVPATDYAALAAKGTLAEIQAFESAIVEHDFRCPPLANNDVAPKAINPNQDGTADIQVSLAPMVSRIELCGVGAANVAQDAVTAFTVTGVYLDDYLPKFNYRGQGKGAMWEQGVSRNFDGVVGDADSWAATGSPLVSKPAADKIWGYNVAPDALPRFIVRIENVEVDGGNVTRIVPNGTDTPVNLAGETFYVTMNGYSTLKAFERGKIYRIGTPSNPLEFTIAHLGLAPNTTGVTLNVKVEIDNWQLEIPAINI